MDKSEKYWDKSASKFDQAGIKDKQTYIKVIDRTKKYLKTSDTVLDFGCGTGLIDNEIADYVKLINKRQIPTGSRIDYNENQTRTIKVNIPATCGRRPLSGLSNASVSVGLRAKAGQVVMLALSSCP
jgi:SAM-dependent methyltransferase